MKRKIFVVLVALALTLSACGGKSELGKQQAQWDAQGVTHYRYQLTISCFCPFMDIMPVTVEVQDGKVLSLTDVNGQPLGDEFRATFEEAATVDGLFALAAGAVNNADKVSIVYDSKFGFPSAIEIDWIEMAIDDEISYYVAGFEVLK